MLKDKHPPEWFLDLLWFIAGIGATGALWYFISSGRYFSASLVAIATALILATVIGLRRRKERSARFEARFPLMTKYMCLMIKLHPHEYHEEETNSRTSSKDPWVIHRRARTELNLLISMLTARQAMTLLSDWLGEKPWEDRLRVAQLIVRRTPMITAEKNVRRDSVARMFVRLAYFDKFSSIPAECAGSTVLPAAGDLRPTLNLFASLVVAGSNQRRDNILDSWIKRRRVIRRDV